MKTVLEALGNIGDFVGGLAVVVTLIYLALQIRQNSKQIERNTQVVAASAFQDLTELVVESNSHIAGDRDFAELRIKARSGISQLDEIDQLRVLASMSSLFRMFENHHLHHAAGLLQEDQFQANLRLMRFHLSHQGTREAWRRIAPTFSSSFRKRVHSLLEERADSSPNSLRE